MESAASFKRARPPGSGNQVPWCSVDGCTADLSKCRDYHRRHKVCEVHSKTPQVSIRGQEQRFCQQCSRFHSLVEFDEGKRSCRKRLDGHNRRRRKPQPDAQSGRFLPTHPATGYLSFSSPQMFSTTLMNESSTGAVKFETNSSSSLNLNSRNISFIGSSSLSHNREKPFSFLQCTNLSHPGVSVCQPLINTNPSSSNGGSSRKMQSDDFNGTLECNGALSLLSSEPAETGDISSSPMVQSGTPASLQYKDLEIGMVSATKGHGRGGFGSGQSGSSASGTQHTPE